MKTPYRIGVVQTSFDNGCVSLNLERMKGIVQTSKEQYPDLKLILFPELAATGYFLSPGIRDCAEKQDGQIYQFMSEAARSQNLYLAYGYVELGEQGQIYNSMMLVDPAGKPAANYRKIHITCLEQDVFKPGNELITVETDLGCIGLMICWDLAFPEMARMLTLKGVELLLVPSAWEKPYDAPYRRFAMARSLDNTVFLATCNHIGKSEALSFFGYSSVFGPDGTVIASVGADAEGIAAAAIDPAARDELRTTFYSMLRERRTDLYALKGESEVGK